MLKQLTTVSTLFLSLIFLPVKAQNDSIQTSVKTKQPKFLEKGDTIAIVAPAGILKNKKKVIDQAKKLAESWELNVLIGKNVFNQNNHFAGTDKERILDFQSAIDNPSVKAIWCARGGYGSIRILDKLNFAKLIENPKWIIGYSDITAFHNHLNTLKIETIHGMMGTSMQFESDNTKESIETLKKALFGEQISYSIPSSNYNIVGNVKGELVGGNLSILVSMLGSKSQVNTDEKILFIEEIGEYKYSIDRMLQSLKRAGYFDNLRGLIVGDMTNIKKNSTKWGSSTEQLILDALAEYSFPILFGFPAGHEADNRALIMGRRIELNISKTNATITFK